MFIIVPLLIIFSCTILILLTVYRKKDYLNKLYILNSAGSVESPVSGSVFSWKSYGLDFFPEIAVLLEKIKFHEHKTMWLIEAEKFLRRTRLIFLRVDRLSDSLIRSIRRIHLNDRDRMDEKNNNDVIRQKEDLKIVIDQSSIGKNEKISSSFLKNEEERLIIEIAKNPKDSSLYESLGDLYIEMNGFTDAKESYEAAIELNPNNEDLRKKLSSALEKLSLSQG